MPASFYCGLHYGQTIEIGIPLPMINMVSWNHLEFICCGLLGLHETWKVGRNGKDAKRQECQLVFGSLRYRHLFVFESFGN